MVIQLDTNRRQDHQHRIWLKIDGQRYPAWLTPDFTNGGSSNRSLILVDLLPSQVPRQYRSAFERFSIEIAGLDIRRLASAKRAVTKILRKEWQDELYRVAVHKMGPVPAFAFKDITLYPPVLNGMAAAVVAFPRATQSMVLPEGSRQRTSALELFYCLVETDNVLLFRSYFEDVFGHFKDVADKLNMIDCMRRMKAVEEVLRTSVGSKLNVLTPSPETWSLYHKEKIPEDSYELDVCRWFEENASTVGDAIYLACMARRCISEFLDLLGMQVDERPFEIRGISYTLENCRTAFTETYRLEAFEESEVISVIDEIHGNYRIGDISALRAMEVSDKRARDLRDFLVFIGTVRRELSRIFSDSRPVRKDAIVFLSRRHESAFGSRAMEAIAEAANEVSSGLSKVTTFEGDGGEPIRESVKGQIWASDAVWSVMPTRDEATEGDLNWLYLEAEHAYLLGKRSLIVARNEDDLESAKSGFSVVDDVMLAETVLADRNELRNHVLLRFEHDVALIASEKDELRRRAILSLQNLRLDAARSRRRSMLVGYLRLFEIDDVRVLRVVFKRFQNKSFSRSQFEKAAVEHDELFNSRDLAGKKFAAAHERSKRHGIIVDGRRFQLIQLLRDRKSYRLNIVQIASKLADSGAISEAEIMRDVEAAIVEAAR